MASCEVAMFILVFCIYLLVCVLGYRVSQDKLDGNLEMGATKLKSARL